VEEIGTITEVGDVVGEEGEEGGWGWGWGGAEEADTIHINTITSSQTNFLRARIRNQSMKITDILKWNRIHQKYLVKVYIGLL